MTTDLFELEKEVHDEASFLVFVEALMKDKIEEGQKEKAHPSSPFSPGANGWENGTIAAFLEAAIAWARDTAKGTPSYKKPDNPWRRCAQILHAGKFCE